VQNCFIKYLNIHIYDTRKWSFHIHTKNVNLKSCITMKHKQSMHANYFIKYLLLTSLLSS